MASPKFTIRTMIERWEQTNTYPTIDEMRELERSIIAGAGIQRGIEQMIMLGQNAATHDCETNLTGELNATKRHLEDMRRLVLLETKDGDV